MKKCPVCQTVYADDSLNYCLSDSAGLQYVRGDSEATVVSRDPNATYPYPPPPPTRPTGGGSSHPPQQGRMVIPLATQTGQAPPPNYGATPAAAQPAPSKGINPLIIVGLVALLLFVVVGAAGAFLLKDYIFPSPSVAVNKSPTPTPEPTATPLPGAEMPEPVATQPPPETRPTTQPSIPVPNAPTPDRGPVNQPPPPTPYPNPTRQPPPPPPPAPTAPPARDTDNGDPGTRNCYQLKIMRNTVYARHGYIFKTPDMIAYFSRQPWYHGTRDDVAGLLSPAEKRYVAQIQQYEAANGCR